ncbi:MAG TPA: DUF488 family protein [Thermoanaerobaculia bacterium]|jgi:uncharacterized protein YeaO (DUF488 family)|nr:DUF488 family protein [Thermoanaerobaculia bacterium]
MSIRVVRLGTDRAKGEGLRLGTVRRPPRGVKKERLAADNWYDVWLPQLSPSADLVKEAQAATTPKQWAMFAKKYRREMAEPDNARLIALLAALSHDTNVAVGCYCADENHCHRSVLREILREAGARIMPGSQK